jgi:hypothetical protein
MGARMVPLHAGVGGVLSGDAGAVAVEGVDLKGSEDGGSSRLALSIAAVGSYGPSLVCAGPHCQPRPAMQPSLVCAPV